MPFPIRYYRPDRPAPERNLWWFSPGMLLTGVLIGHLIEAASR